MQPWKSKRVVENKREESTSISRYAAPQHGAHPLSISKAAFRPANPSKWQSKSSDLPIDLISSPSRGIDASDSSRDLTNHETQDLYRTHLSHRLKAHRDKYGPLLRAGNDDLFPITLPAAKSPSKWCADGLSDASLGSLQDVLLLIRRLREGCVAAGRQDAFTIDVYILSTALSLLIGDDIQLGSSLPRLVDLIGTAPWSTCETTRLDLRVLLGESSVTLLDESHAASLYMLWLSVLGGQVTRIGGTEKEMRKPGGAYLQERARIMQKLSEEEQSSRWIEVTQEVHTALVEDNVIRFRQLLINKHFSLWQRALVRRGIERMRGLVWSTIVKAYLHAPLDGRVFGEETEGNDWLERMLFIDVDLMPPSAARTAQSTASIPEAWDDDNVESVTAILHSTSLQQDQYLFQLRASRLACIFETFHLAESASNSPAHGPLERWSGRQVLQGGISHLKLR